LLRVRFVQTIDLYPLKTFSVSSTYYYTRNEERDQHRAVRITTYTLYSELLVNARWITSYQYRVYPSTQTTIDDRAFADWNEEDWDYIHEQQIRYREQRDWLEENIRLNAPTRFLWTTDTTVIPSLLVE
jgi:hypothetical protein